MFNLRLLGLVSTGAWPIPASVGDVGQDFAGDGGCGTLSISEHWLNRWWWFWPCPQVSQDGEKSRYKLLYNALHIKVSHTIVSTVMSTNNDGFPHRRQNPSALKAPNINFAKEVYALRLMRNTVEAIFIAPKLQRPRGDSCSVHVMAILNIGKH